MASSYGSLAKEAIVLLDKFSAGRQCLDDFMEEASKDLQCVSCVWLQFLTFFFTNLTTWIQEEWNHIYDAAYVDKHWIGPLLRWRPEMDIFLDQLSVNISRGSQFKKAPIRTTEPQEFSLTKPKPRPLPLPELIPLQEKSKPVPKSTYMAPKEMQMMEEIKKKNHQKTEELLYEANVKQFRCVNPLKSEHTKRAMSQIMEDMDSKLKFNSFHSSGCPSSNKTNSWPIKLNSAAILRQGALCDRQVEEELQRMERLVEGTHEPSSFLQWQKEMREKDFQDELATIERRRLEGRISYEEAAMARTRIMERNQKTAQLKKEETAQLMRTYAEKRMQEEKEIRDLVQQVAEGHKNSKKAKEKLQKFKQSIVKEVSEQRRELLRQALEEAQAELSRKFEIIREIHAIESLPHIRVRNFDDTETAGHELLGEMSLVELKERLALLREAQQTEQQEKRELILEEKQNKKQLLLEQLDTNNLHTRALAQAAAIRKEERKARSFFRQAITQDDTVLALQKKLEEKKQERQRQKQTESKEAKPCELAAAHTVRNTGTHDKKSLTVKSWEELELSLERHIQKDTPYVVSQSETLKT
ncbi:cilia- and flagella-associated protein 99 isoform X2 [Cottoperca gobio]|uniref:Cilia- and flagella-associated protein 99 isoform X2 n=1 Tax=Cottoperca gobio TaxID=56716 RepID=A0A6J2S450_COTGO|nr:cilia- and flagella-associated protein 99 isoform X2 [Cottoperca gobio]